MRRYVLPSALALGAVLLVAACSGDSASPTGPNPMFNSQGPPPPCNPDRTLQLIRELFKKRTSLAAEGDDRIAAGAFFNLVTMAGRTPPGPNPAATRSAALQLVDFTLDKFHAGELIGGTSSQTQALAAEFMSNVLCLAALPPFDQSTLGDDGAAEVVLPNSDPTTVVTPTGFAATNLPTGAVTQPTLITIRRLPDTPGPLLTQLDQYPIYYEFDYNPATTFEIPVTVVVCTTATVEYPDPTRLRLGHNIAPYTMGSIEILQPAAEADFVDCTEAGLATAPSRGRLHDLARGGVDLLKGVFNTFAPQPLFAARKFGTGGLSGSVRTFSPFGAVDTLGLVVPVTDTRQSAAFGSDVGQVPTVQVRAPSGRPMVGIPVNFAVTDGNGTIGIASTVTDNLGKASAGSWRIGFTNPNAVTSTVTYTPGSGFIMNPIRFEATGFAP